MGPLPVGLATRRPLPSDSTIAIRRIVSPTDEALDLSDAERKEALRLTIANWHERGGAARGGREPRVPVGWSIRRMRTPERGLLLVYPLHIETVEGTPVVGFAVSFPGSGADREIEYMVNQVHLQNEFGWELEQ